MRNLLKGYMCPGRRLTKIRATTGPDFLWPEIGSGMSKAVQTRERGKGGLLRSQSSTMLEKLRDIFFIDPEDEEYKETLKNTRKKLETPLETAMPCKELRSNCKASYGKLTHTTSFEGNDAEYEDFRFSIRIHMSLVGAVSQQLMDQCEVERNPTSLATVQALGDAHLDFDHERQCPNSCPIC